VPAIKKFLLQRKNCRVNFFYEIKPSGRVKKDDRGDKAVSMCVFQNQLTVKFFPAEKEKFFLS
jgi:hypothetical protein